MPFIDPTVFAGHPLQSDVVDPAAPAAGPVIPELTKAPDNAILAPNAPSVVQAGQIREQASVAPASMLESASAAFQLTDTAKLYRAVKNWDEDGDGPRLTAQELNDFMMNLPRAPTQEQRELLLESTTMQGLKNRWQRVQELDELARVAGDHQAVAFAMYVVDPVQTLASFGIGKLAGVGRAVNTAAKTQAAARRAFGLSPLAAPEVAGSAKRAAAATLTSAAVPLAVEAVSVDPDRTVGELMLESAMSAAGGFMQYRHGIGMVKRDLDFPHTELNTVLGALQGAKRYRVVEFEQEVDEVIPASKRTEVVSPAEYVDEVVPGTPAVYDELPHPTPRKIATSKPRFGYRGDNYTIEFDSWVDKAAYIIAGRGKSAKHEDILLETRRITGMSEREIIEHGEALRALMKEQASGKTAADWITDGNFKIPVQYAKELPKQRVLRTPETASSTVRRLVKPEVTREIDVPEQVVRKKVKNVRFEEVPDELAVGVTHSDPSTVIPAIDKVLDKPTGWLDRMYWNMHKTLSGYGPIGREVADLLVDNNSNLAKTSIESSRIGVLTDLRQLEMAATDEVLALMKERGAGTWAMFVSPRKSMAVQDEVMTAVQRELDRQANLTRLGKPITQEGVDPKIFSIAEKYNATLKRAAEELQRAGVQGAENLQHYAGYYPRRWSAYRIEKMIDKLNAAGQDGATAIKRMVAASVQKANPGMGNEIAYDIGASIINRAIRKGEFEDMLFAVPAGEGQLALMRDILKEEVAAGSLTHNRMERILDVMRQSSEDRGKAAFLKHRTVLDPEYSEMLGGTKVQVSDLFDNRLETSVSRYNERVATQVAFANKGLNSQESINNLRKRFLESVDPARRGEAQELFDNITNLFMGKPTGEKMNSTMRLAGAYTRAISLGMAGIWQFAETAIIMGRYGLGKTLKYAFKESPVIRSMFKDATKGEARSMRNIMVFHAEEQLRLKPYMYRFEDNFAMPTDSALQLAAQRMGQLVPYVNGMKYIHSMQARMTAGLIMDRIEQAAKGNSKARKLLNSYGLDDAVMDKIAQQSERHGWSVDNWDDGVWSNTRPALGKMMDEAVLHSRLGDTPAFIQFDKVGKFIWTYRNFIVTAHNKLMVGRTARNGIGATALVALYQMPLAALAVNTASILKGEGPLEGNDLLNKTATQLSVLGLFTEAYKIVTGQLSSFGAPGLIAVDRALRLGSAVASGDAERAGELGLNMIPLFAVSPFTKGVASAFGDD